VAKFPETRISLILRLAHPDDVAAWQEFTDIYAPAIYALATRKGIQPADAEDLTQEALFGIARAIDRFRPDSDRAKFRTWLNCIVRNVVADYFAGRAKRPISQSLSDSWLRRATRHDALHPEHPEHAEQEAFELETRQALFRLAAARVRERVSAAQWQAFEATAVHQRGADEVARELNLSLGNLYVARCRVLKLLRGEVERLARHHSGSHTHVSQELPS
jgi:RNA polymerase sigma-70 factor, ECF subfamily